MSEAFNRSEVYFTFTYQGKEETDFNPEKAIAQLVSNDVLFSNFRTYSYNKDKLTNDGTTIVLFANCSDVFAWGCADAEDVSSEEELKSLYDYCEKYGGYEGRTIWACMKRKEQPQEAVAKYLKERNCWPKELDSLHESRYDILVRENYGDKNTTNE
jgi:hypothetical protein